MELKEAIRIQKGIPIPPLKQGPRKEVPPQLATKYPFVEMKVGESFLFPMRIGRAAFMRAKEASLRSGMKFVVRKIEDRYRCWRIK